MRIWCALRRQVGERTGSAAGVLVVDDTGFEKNGRGAVACRRTWSTNLIRAGIALTPVLSVLHDWAADTCPG